MIRVKRRPTETVRQPEQRDKNIRVLRFAFCKESVTVTVDRIGSIGSKTGSIGLESVTAIQLSREQRSLVAGMQRHLT